MNRNLALPEDKVPSIMQTEAVREPQQTHYITKGDSLWISWKY